MTPRKPCAAPAAHFNLRHQHLRKYIMEKPIEVTPAQCRLIILNAYDRHNAYRQSIAKLHTDLAAYRLRELVMLSAPTLPDSLENLTIHPPGHQFWQALEVANDAHRLGGGVLIAEYLIRRTTGHYNLLPEPIITTYNRLADRAMAAMIKVWEDHTQARAVPELGAAYANLDKMLGLLGDLQRDDENGAMHRRDAAVRLTRQKVDRVVRQDSLYAA